MSVPGLLAIFSGETARCEPLPLAPGAHVLGREGLGASLGDRRMSRHHAEIGFDGQCWRIHDLGSHNGTFLDGVRVGGARVTPHGRVLRVGETVFRLLDDVRPFQGAGVETRDGVVLGPSLRACWDEIAGAAPEGALHIVGESGSGKELAARHFHRSGAQAAGPFVAATCAALSPADLQRHLHAARAGTLFLDDAGELEPELRPELAAVAARGEPRICTAATRVVPSLPAVRLPPLRRRVEEIPWLMQLRGLPAHASLVEACVTRPWPGNVRELLAELRVAAQRAQAQSATRITAEHLAPIAGSSPH